LSKENIKKLKLAFTKPAVQNNYLTPEGESTSRPLVASTPNDQSVIGSDVPAVHEISENEMEEEDKMKRYTPLGFFKILDTVNSWTLKKKVISYEGSRTELDFDGFGCQNFLTKILHIDLVIRG
jgi:hypothetical protein